ncbi:hypothetical protein NP233_g4480 [Leucocoprinus birnbaumii]|uniref:Uncharacterized protein n=1 Tax=Leucocoprinus birnbaumii TaxID=56174 RepID=A0AAD5YXK0_9AGAR|nr:hypothetical protein NP233_g4480 [Leucocoprinus birnbaumii]
MSSYSHPIENIVKNEHPDDAPDFPHAWTFSAQRYVPRPRPVARIILPSHHRSFDCVLYHEALSPKVAFSSTDSLNWPPSLKLVPENDELDSIVFERASRAQRVYQLKKHLSVSINAVKNKIIDGLKAIWLPICRNFPTVGRSTQPPLHY